MHPLLKELERDNDPHDVLEIAPGVVLAARAEPEFPTLAPGAMSRAAEPQIYPRPSGAGAAPSLDATFRADDAHKVPGDRSSSGTWARRLFIGILLSVCGAVAAAPWQHYGDAAKATIASWVPQLVATTSPPAHAASSEQADAPDTQATAPAAAAAPPAAPAQPAEAVAPNAPASDQAQSLASMAQQIDQLKANVEQLKAGQEQMSRDIAKASEMKASEVRAPEPSVRPRIAVPKMAAPPRPAAALTRKPRPTASAAPYLPPPPLPPAAAPPIVPQPVPEARATVETDGNPVVRPPLPVR